MSANEDSETQVVHADDFTHPAVLRVVQFETAVLCWHLQAEAAELPESLCGGFVDLLKDQEKVELEIREVSCPTHRIRVIFHSVIDLGEEFAHWIHEASDIFGLLLVQSDWEWENLGTFHLTAE
jgi:hypothetical protein